MLLHYSREENFQMSAVSHHNDNVYEEITKYCSDIIYAEVGEKQDDATGAQLDDYVPMSSGLAASVMSLNCLEVNNEVDERKL